MKKILRIASRMAGIDPFWAMDLVAEANRLQAAGRDIVSMQVGEPDFPTAAPIVRAAIEAVESGDVHYTASCGIAPLREAIARFYSDRYGVSIPPSRVIVTPGASGALLLATGVLVGPGDEVLMADPGYPCNRHFVRLMEGKAKGIAVGAENDWQLTPKLVAEHWTDGTAAVLVASPSNPTGTVLSDDALRGIIEVAEERGGIAIVDEIYHGLTYQRSLPTALRFSDNVVVINSFSKYFGMTGWRLGWTVVPEWCVREFDKLAQNVFLSPPTISQHAALAAFLPETIAILDARRDEFRARRDFLGAALPEIGIDIPVFPDGAFYCYADVSRFSSDSFAFAHDLLHGAGVAITPGRDFGSNAPEKHVRFAYTTSLERLALGVERLREFLT